MKKDKIPFLLTGAFLIGAVLTHLLDTKVHRQEVETLEEDFGKKAIREHSQGFSKGWKDGFEYGLRTAHLNRDESSTIDTTD